MLPQQRPAGRGSSPLLLALVPRCGEAGTQYANSDTVTRNTLGTAHRYPEQHCINGHRHASSLGVLCRGHVLTRRAALQQPQHRHVLANSSTSLHPKSSGSAQLGTSGQPHGHKHLRLHSAIEALQPDGAAFLTAPPGPLHPNLCRKLLTAAYTFPLTHAGVVAGFDSAAIMDSRMAALPLTSAATGCTTRSTSVLTPLYDHNKRGSHAAPRLSGEDGKPQPARPHGCADCGVSLINCTHCPKCFCAGAVVRARALSCTGVGQHAFGLWIPRFQESGNLDCENPALARPRPLRVFVVVWRVALL